MDGKMISQVTAGIAAWVMQDCGDVFESRMKLSKAQLEAHQPMIFPSSKHEKMLKQIYLNKFIFIGVIKAILVRDVEMAKPISTFLRKLGIEGKDWPEAKKEIIEKGYDEVLKNSKAQPFGQNTIVDAMIVDCGVPIRLNYGNKENRQFLKHWGWGCSLQTLQPGIWVAGECDLSLLTCVDGGFIWKQVSGVVSKVYKLIKDPKDKNFGEIMEIKNSENPFELGLNEIFVTLDINEIGELGHDVEGRISEVLI